jgi:hypothetical protein
MQKIVSIVATVVLTVSIWGCNRSAVRAPERPTQVDVISACPISGAPTHTSDSEIRAWLRKLDLDITRRVPIRKIQRKPQGWEREGDFAESDLPFAARATDVFVVEGELNTYVLLAISDATWEYCIKRIGEQSSIHILVK